MLFPCLLRCKHDLECIGNVGCNPTSFHLVHSGFEELGILDAGACFYDGEVEEPPKSKRHANVQVFL